MGLVAELGDGAKLLAGGQSLVPMLNLRLAVFDHLVDLRRVEELRGIERRDDGLWIGAGTTQAAIEASAEVADAVPPHVRPTALIRHFQIRNRGTIGGSLAHADPAAEYPAVAVALDAALEARSARGARTIPAADFFVGLWTSTLADDEVLTGVTFPVWDGRTGSAIEELARRHGDFAVAGAVVAVQLDAADRVERSAVALLGMGPTPVRAVGAETEAAGGPVADLDADAIGQAAVSGLDAVPSDLHGSAAYRTRVGAAMVSRAWTRAVDEARRG